MATVTSFENLQHPSRSELRQFAELFQPLFSASSEDARRQAVAALSQCPTVPKPVALFIASQPISIAAPFLIASQCLDDEMLILIARTQGQAHARAIVRRENLSPTVIDALVGLRHAMPPRRETPAGESPPLPAADTGTATGTSGEADRTRREEKLREDIRNLARHVNRPEEDRLGLRSLSPVQEALLIRFARERETVHFATTLADALSASRWLAERILLDLSGQQLATTLAGLGMDLGDAAFVLERLYPHLAESHNGLTKAGHLLAGLDPARCGERVEAWRRADSYTFRDEEAEEAGKPAAAAQPAAAPRRAAARRRR